MNNNTQANIFFAFTVGTNHTEIYFCQGFAFKCALFYFTGALSRSANALFFLVGVCECMFVDFSRSQCSMPLLRRESSFSSPNACCSVDFALVLPILFIQFIYIYAFVPELCGFFSLLSFLFLKNGICASTWVEEFWWFCTKLKTSVAFLNCEQKRNVMDFSNKVYLVYLLQQTVKNDVVFYSVVPTFSSRFCRQDFYWWIHMFLNSAQKAITTTPTEMSLNTQNSSINNAEYTN